MAWFSALAVLIFVKLKLFGVVVCHCTYLVTVLPRTCPEDQSKVMIFCQASNKLIREGSGTPLAWHCRTWSLDHSLANKRRRLTPDTNAWTRLLSSRTLK